ncbi:hypothetical protein MBA17_21935, partial [Streptosporangium sp. KLBMP 9127]|nr:hypothetical protein [Streptosporangium sp. KLBMP 9127]
MGKFDGMDPKLVRQLLAEVKRAATEMRTTEGRVARLVSAAGVPSGTAHRPVQVADAADDMVRDVTSRLTLLEKKEKDQTATEPARNGQTPRDADESVVQTKDPEDKGTRSDRDGNPRTDMPSEGADKDDKGTKDETPAPKQDTPAPKDETPPPKQDTPPPRDETPPPREDTPPPKEDTPPPRDETPPPKEDTPPPQQDDPTPKEEDRDPKGDREDNPRDDRGGNTDPTDPEGGNTDPSDPEGGNTDPSDPEGGNTDPSDPEGGNTDPSDPEGGNTDPTGPEGGNTDPDSQDRPDTPEKDHPNDSDGPGGSRRELEVDGVRIIEQQFERPTMEELRYIIDNMENAKPLDIPSVEYGESWEGPGSPTPDGPPGQVEPSLPSSEDKSDGPVPEQNGPATDQAVQTVQTANGTVSQPDTLRAAEVGTPYGSEARIGTDLPPAAGGIEYGAEPSPADETPPPKEDTPPPQQDDAAPKEEDRDDSQDRPDTPEKDHPNDSDGPGGSRRELEVDGVRIIEQQFERPTMEELRYIIDNMENAKPLDIPSVEYGESWEGPGSPTPDGPPGQVEPSLPSSEDKS